MVSGGSTHPLSRDRFAPREYLTVSRKVSGTLQTSVLRRGCDYADNVIIKTLGVIRAVNFLILIRAHGECESLYLFFLMIDCIDTRSNIGEYSRKLKETRFAHVLFASRPDVDPLRVHAVLESQNLQDKCDFLDEIECLLVDFDLGAYETFLKPVDMFALIDALRDYNVETKYM
jgi:hypothetical protein